MSKRPEYIVTIRILGKGEWPYSFDTIEDAAEQAHRWCDEALNAPNPEDYQIIFDRTEREIETPVATADPVGFGDEVKS